MDDQMPPAEIVARVVPARLDLSERTYSKTTKRKKTASVYDVFLYTTLPTLRQDVDPVLIRPVWNQPETIADLPLASIEKLRINWDYYLDYLGSFLEGEKAPRMMLERLLETMSPGLENLFGGGQMADGPVRVWWDINASELEELPWELVAYLDRQDKTGFSFVRGRPPTYKIPQVPIGDKLRLAVISDSSSLPFFLKNLNSDLFIEVTLIDMSLQKSLQYVVKEGFELLHIIADGYVSSAHDGLLYFHQFDGLSLSAVELSARLRGSQVTAISLSTPNSSDPRVVDIGRHTVPSAYRAFAHLADADHALPSIIAPLGSLYDFTLESFWQSFYKHLAKTLSIEQATSHARQENPYLPMALFLRHPHRKVFRKIERSPESIEQTPAMLQTELELSQSLVESLNILIDQFGEKMPKSVAKLLTEEPNHQDRLRGKIDSWLE